MRPEVRRRGWNEEAGRRRMEAESLQAHQLNQGVSRSRLTPFSLAHHKFINGLDRHDRFGRNGVFYVRPLPDCLRAHHEVSCRPAQAFLGRSMLEICYLGKRILQNSDQEG